MKKIYVLRKGIILSSKMPTMQFGDDNIIVVPMAVLEYVYTYRGLPEKQKMAIDFMEYIKSIPKTKLLSIDGYVQENGSILKVVDNKRQIDKKIENLQNLSNLDKRCYQVCLDLEAKYPDTPIILISQNPIIQIGAEKIGLEAQPFKNGLFPPLKEQYKGFVTAHTAKCSVDNLYKEGRLPIEEIDRYEEIDWQENMFVNLQTESSPAIGRYTSGMIVPLKYSNQMPSGYRALNMEQKMLWECLLAPPEEAPLVIVKGAAGTGKTFCSLAMALEKIRRYADSKTALYDQVLVAAPTVTVSNEKIGALPGEIDAKVGPYLGGIMDNLKAIFRFKNTGFNNKELKSSADYLFEKGLLEVQPIGFLRGRTIPYTCFIIDETQNIRPSDIKDIVTRAAKGSKFIFLGDPEQINNPELNTRYNGLVYLSEKMKGSKLSWQITLSKSVRGELAEEALQVL